MIVLTYGAMNMVVINLSSQYGSIKLLERSMQK